MGTADTQSLQPWPFWKQWLAKFATVAVIALLLGLAVPRGLQAVLPLIDSSWPVGPDLGDFRFLLPNPLNGGVATILLTTLFSCYISSLCVGAPVVIQSGITLHLPVSCSVLARPHASRQVRPSRILVEGSADRDVRRFQDVISVFTKDGGDRVPRFRSNALVFLAPELQIR